MWLKWLPWKYIVRKLAHSHGFLDPVSVLAKVRSFSQPSEVQEPIELLRAGMILHTRGLMNSRAIQQNLDWVWPWWVNRQFDPEDPAFVPRAFSLTHINLTHRNWTALGIPDISIYPLVDPGGGITPQTDGWTLEGWIVSDTGRFLVPSRLDSVHQYLGVEENLSVETLAEDQGMSLGSRVEVVLEKGLPFCHIRYIGRSDYPGWMVVALRPYNPEGVAFIHKIRIDKRERNKWFIEDRAEVFFESPVERHLSSNYREGDVSLYVSEMSEQEGSVCEVGMCTAGAFFRLEAGIPRQIGVRAEIRDESHESLRSSWSSSEEGWEESLKGHCSLSIPDEKMQFLYDAAIRTLILHSPGDIFPGPYTYRRFWFRDAAFILQALICANLTRRAERALDRFPARQNAFGFFHSQDGEWDSNGEAIWIIHRFCRCCGISPKREWLRAVESGANWIIRKRIPPGQDPVYGGLLPAGFSAEHLGANDHYYWDNFWSIAGLEAAASMMSEGEKSALALKYGHTASDYMSMVEESLLNARERIGRAAMPAAPMRRLDAGAIGSIVAGYPLQFWAPGDERIMDSVEWLMENSFFQGGFFQDMVHSGINAYLTLHIAQILLRAGDERYGDLARNVADLATATGQWPEAIHPWTGGGCMGDGQHVWAAAEWIMLMRNALVLEELKRDRLILGAGIARQWLSGTDPLKIGPTPTAWGPVDASFLPQPGGKVRIEWRGSWFHDPPEMEIRIPGCHPFFPGKGDSSAEIDLGGGDLS